MSMSKPRRHTQIFFTQQRHEQRKRHLKGLVLTGENDRQEKRSRAAGKGKRSFRGKSVTPQRHHRAEGRGKMKNSTYYYSRLVSLATGGLGSTFFRLLCPLDPIRRDFVGFICFVGLGRWVGVPSALRRVEVPAIPVLRFSLL